VIALVVDDSMAMRRIQGKALEAMGYQVSTAGNGVEALAVLGALTRCDLLLTDWHMPEMEGIDLVRAVRKDPRWASIRIVMVTSESDTKAIESALAAGADDFLMKPFTADTLAARITEVMRA